MPPDFLSSSFERIKTFNRRVKMYLLKKLPIDKETRSGMRHESGSTLLQLIIVFAVIAVISAFALVNMNSARSTLRLQNSVRQLASYLEKARLDAVRRHANSSVVFNSTSTYDITMDFDGSGNVSTRTFPFENGVSIVSTPLPSLTFNWRGRISACTVRFTAQNSGEQSWVSVSDAGDVTVNSSVDITTTMATYATVDTNSSVYSTAVVSGSEVHNNTVDCDGTSPPPGPPISGGPGCPDTVNPSSISIRKHGGTTAQITVTATNTGTVAVSAPINLSVTPASQAVTGGGSATFSITSINNATSTFAVNFTTPCAQLTVLVTVTN
jgi:type II secretory pathway pseudopilin PulG